MTDECLDRIERLAREATAPPWHARHGGYVYGNTDRGGEEVCVTPNGRRQAADLAFIAAAREAVPALAAEVRRLKGGVPPDPEPEPEPARPPSLFELPVGALVEMRVGSKSKKNLRWVPAALEFRAGTQRTFRPVDPGDGPRMTIYSHFETWYLARLRVPASPSPLARMQANVFSDWLEEHGFAAASAKLREAFPLIPRE